MISRSPDTKVLYEEWRQKKDDETKRRVVKSLEPTIQSAIHSYGGGDEGLTTKAKLMVWDAIDTYDPKKNTALTTYVHSHLRGLHRIRGERQSVVKVPENTRLDRTRVQAFVDEWRGRQGFEPDELTIADGLGITRKTFER